MAERAASTGSSCFGFIASMLTLALLVGAATAFIGTTLKRVDRLERSVGIPKQTTWELLNEKTWAPAKPLGEKDGELMVTALIVVSLLALVEFLVLLWLCRRIAPLVTSITLYRESTDKQIARSMERIQEADAVLSRMKEKRATKLPDPWGYGDPRCNYDKSPEFAREMEARVKIGPVWREGDSVTVNEGERGKGTVRSVRWNETSTSWEYSVEFAAGTSWIRHEQVAHGVNKDGEAFVPLPKVKPIPVNFGGFVP